MECHLSRITVHYESRGRGRPLVVLPGWPDDWTVPADYLEPVMRSRPGWRRIYLDLPGRGRTEGASWIKTNDQVLEIVLQVLDRLIPRERFVVAGHSTGGYLARAVLHRRMASVDGLLQVVPEFPDDDDEELPERTPLVSDADLLERIRRELGPDLATAFRTGLVVQTPQIYERFKTLVPGFRGHDAEFLARLPHTLSFDVDRLPSPFLHPALFVLGRQDAIVGHRGAVGLMDRYPRDNGRGSRSRRPRAPLGAGRHVPSPPPRLGDARRGERSDGTHRARLSCRGRGRHDPRQGAGEVRLT